MPATLRPARKSDRKRVVPVSVPAIRERLNFTWLCALVGVFLVVGFELYSPALRGAFFFDDLNLPFARADAAQQSLAYWLNGVRPALMLTYLWNSQLSGVQTLSYHMFNLFIHVANALLVLAIALRLLKWAGAVWRTRLVLALFVSGIFLVHPLETEAVSYIAGRSESLAALFALAAWAVFVYRRQQEIRWPHAVTVLILSGLAISTKENFVALPIVLLLTDYFWNQPFTFSGIRGNWRLYAPMVASIVPALWLITRVLGHSKSAGFSTAGFTPLTYFLTETRALLDYIRLTVFPIGQSIDHDIATSHTLLEHGAILALLAWAAVVAAAWHWRKRFPLAVYGLGVFLLLLAPTSSVVPIADALVERRMYLPLLGLLLIACEFLRRAHLDTKLIATMAALVLFYGAVTYQRNELWADPFQLWTSAVASMPQKGRTYNNFAATASYEGRCLPARPYFEKAYPALSKDSYFLIGDAKVAECLGDKERALGLIDQAVRYAPADPSAMELKGLVYGELGRMGEAKAALDKAVSLAGRREDTPYESRGLWYEASGQIPEAEQDYKTAVHINPKNYRARLLLMNVGRNLGASDRRVAP